MQIRPILAALSRHRIAAFLIGAEIALACAILCNALFLITARLDMMRVDSGVDENRLVVLSLDGVDDGTASDLAARLRAGFAGIAGVQSVAVANAMPFTQRAGEFGFRLRADDPHYNHQGHIYVGGPNFASTLGLQLAAGRWFSPDEYGPVGDFLPESRAVMVDSAYASTLWPGESPLGKMIYVSGEDGYRVVGTYRSLVRPDPDPSHTHNSLLMAGVPGKHLASVYVLRTGPEQTARVLDAARALVTRVAPTVVINDAATGTEVALRRQYFARDRAMAGMLVGVIAALLLVTALGIVGLASFWVQQRRKQIGVRRALGATRGDIVRYFQTENFLIVSFGILFGMVLAFGLNLVLMSRYELPRLPLYYLPFGALALWALGQLAVLAPALRASHVPPVVATRSV
ncbi:ABC transporter permease [Fulvimonas yonginensis]|uniref:FtsX-like permease family protein n=1 Tax=Fulvimonas yonginensis TaxID=1495200 RepID=A0ABU8JB37_9GAMM